MTDGTPFPDEAPETASERSDYHEGRRAFWAGVPVGTIIARLQCEGVEMADTDLDYVCGFLDAGLDALRLTSGFVSGLSGQVGS